MPKRARGRVPPLLQANQAQPQTRRRFYLSGTVLFILLVLQLAALRALPYSTSLLENVAPEEVMAQSEHPQKGFSIGSIRWDIRRYANDPRLEPFRHYFREYCNGKKGIAAALCLSDRFAEQFPFGPPSDDFFKADYDPVASLIAHTQKGEPGHCVTRSGLAAAALLSMGIPAHVIQLIPSKGPGHNIFSVWDEEYGWVAIDPLTGYMIGNEKGPTSALVALQSPDKVKSFRLAGEPKGMGDLNIIYEGEKAPLFRGQLAYPEPWLYLRTGERAAYWPFRGAFVYTGPWEWWIGPAQMFLHYGIAVCCALITLFVGALLTGTARKYLKQRQIHEKVFSH